MLTQEKIFKESELLFMKYGIKSISMDDISRGLGISKKTLYQYVDNKADLIHNVMQFHLEEEKIAMSLIHTESNNAVEEILKIAKYVIKILRNLSPTTVFDLKKYYKKTWDLIESMHHGHVYQVIKENMQWGMKDQLYRDDINTDILAKLYVGEMSLIVDDELFSSSKYNKEKLYKEFIKYHIRGIASPKGLKLFQKIKDNIA